MAAAQSRLRAGVPESTFHEYLKSLRKLGIPFERTSNRRKRLRYLHYHIMELALILSLRVYHVVPDSVLREIVRHREQLFPLYRSAYARRASGKGKAIDLAAVSGKEIQLRGLFIDLWIGFAGGQLSQLRAAQIVVPCRRIGSICQANAIGRVFFAAQFVAVGGESGHSCPFAAPETTTYSAEQSTVSRALPRSTRPTFSHRLQKRAVVGPRWNDCQQTVGL